MNYKSKKVEFDESIVSKKALAESTNKAFGDSKSLMIVANSLSLFMSLVILITTIMTGFRPLMLMAICTLVTSEIIHLVYCIFVNFKFRYTRFWSMAFIIASVVFTMIIFLMDKISNAVFNQQVMYISKHAISWIFGTKILQAILFLAVYRLSSIKKAKTFSKILLTIILSAITISFTVLSFGGGYYNENMSIENSNKAIYYIVKQDSEGQYLQAKSALRGTNSNVYIPEKFNGLKVKEIDIALLEDNSIKKVFIESSSQLDFVNLNNNTSINKNIQIVVDRGVVDGYRQQALGAFEGEKALDIALAFQPKLEQGESFLNIVVDDALIDSQYKNIFIPTIIFKTQQNIQDVLNANTKLSSLISKSNDYQWNYNHNNKQVFYGAFSGDENFFDQTITQSVSLKVKFDNVYKINVSKGQYNYVDENWKNIIYATSNNCDIDLSTNRLGCSANWKIKKQNQTKYTNINNSQDIASFLSTDQSEYYLYPDWSVDKVAFEKFETKLGGTAQEKQSFVFGDKITFEFEMQQHPLVDNAYYDFYYQKNLSDTKTMLKENVKLVGSETLFDYINKLMVVSQSGYYTIKATYYDTFDTSLKAQQQTTIFVEIAKKQLDCQWKINNQQNFGGITYNGDINIIECNVATNQLVEGHFAFARLQQNQFKNAGDYSIVASLSDEENYTLNPNMATKNFSIAPKILSVDKSMYQNLIYKGENFQLTPIVSGFVAGESLDIEILQNHPNIYDAKTYEIEILLHNYQDFLASNYIIIQDNKFSFEVHKKTIQEIVWQINDYIYNGLVQIPKASFEGVGDDSWIQLNISGDSRNAGDYIAVAQNNNLNYNITCTATQPYSIAKCIIKHLQWSNNIVVYDGESQTMKASFEGVEQDGIVLVGTTGGGIDVGVYNIVATPDNNNYDMVCSLENSLQIVPLEVEVQWGTDAIMQNDLSIGVLTQLSGTLQYHFQTLEGVTIEQSHLQEGTTYNKIVTSTNHNFDLKNNSLQFVYQIAIGG